MNSPARPPLPNRVGPATFRPKVPQASTAIPAAVIEEATPKGPDGSPLSSAYERVDLPSNCVPYDFDTISIRKITALDHAKLFRAVKHRNMTVLLDALSSTLTVDIRKLTVEDFRAVCYWHRAHSYLASPLSVTWRSIYGNACSDSITGAKIKYETKSIQKTREDYERERTEKGFVLPTCADLEVLMQIEDEERLFLFENAQFLDPAPLVNRIAVLKKTSRSPSVDARIERFNELTSQKGMAILEEIRAYTEAFQSSIIEKAHVRDRDFEVEAAIKHLTNTLEDSELPASVREEVAEELSRITTAKEAGQEVEAKEEVHALPFNVWNFFPYT